MPSGQTTTPASSSILHRKDPDPKDAPQGSSLEDILPPKGGVLAAIDRRILLGDIFGEEGLEQLIRDVKANPAALEFTRKNGILAVLALADTRGPRGLDPGKAKAALEAKETKDLYRRALLEPRAAAPKSFWFQPKPPAETVKEKIGEEEIPVSPSRLTDVVSDPQNPFVIPAPTVDRRTAGPPITVNFAFLGSDLRGNKASDEIQRGRQRILEAIQKVSIDIASLPDAPSAAERIQDKRVRARLREAVRGFTVSKPLRIFLASGGHEVLRGLALRTETVFVRKEDTGDDTKLEAAIRAPLVAFLGSPPPFEKDRATAEEGGEALLHEMVHTLLIHRGLSANDLWEKIKDKIVQGAPTVKNRAEETTHSFLLAQEEVFVYKNVSQLGKEYSHFAGQNQVRYEVWILEVERFLRDRGVALEKKTNKLDVKDKVAGKKVDWSIEFKFPRAITVTGTDLTPLNRLIADFHLLTH